MIRRRCALPGQVVDFGFWIGKRHFLTAEGAEIAKKEAGYESIVIFAFFVVHRFVEQAGPWVMLHQLVRRNCSEPRAGVADNAGRKNGPRSAERHSLGGFWAIRFAGGLKAAVRGVERSSKSKISNRHSSIVNPFLFPGDEDLLGHEDITTTEIYLHVAMGENGLGVESPLDELVG